MDDPLHTKQIDQVLTDAAVALQQTRDTLGAVGVLVVNLNRLVVRVDALLARLGGQP